MNQHLMSSNRKWWDLSDEVLRAVTKPNQIDYIYRCPRCGLAVCRCGATQISGLKAGMQNLVLAGTIVDAEAAETVQTNHGDTLLAKAFLEDQSGKIRLNLWGEHSTKASSGRMVRLENAFASTFGNELVLNLGWHGTFLSNQTSGLSVLERRLSYFFRRRDLLVQALTRRSHLNEHKEEKTWSSEPLSFLGDSVLQLVVSDYLFSRNPGVTEAQLTVRRQDLVSEPQCATAGARLKLYDYLRVGGGEKPLAHKQAIISEAYEALIGAIFLDGLYESASAVVKDTLLKPLTSG
jgi:hypothetical protein